MSYPAGYPGVCPDCATPRQVSSTYDAVLCAPCDEWQSPACRPRSCATCWDRPSRSSLAADLDLAPADVHPSYDLDLSDTDEVLRRVVLPVVLGTVPSGTLDEVRISRTPQSWQEHWPPDVPLPEDVWCDVYVRSGGYASAWLGVDGVVNAVDLAGGLAERLEDAWCESTAGWGEQVTARYEVLPPRPPA